MQQTTLELVNQIGCTTKALFLGQKNILSLRPKEHFEVTEHLGYDEFGYKVWTLNTDYGYLVYFEVYQGKNTTANSTDKELFVKSTAPLMNKLDDLQEDKIKFPCHILTDTLFRSKCAQQS